MKKFLSLFIFLSITLFSRTDIDSILSLNESPQRIIEILNGFAEKNFKNAPNEALTYLEKSFELLQEINYPSEEARAYLLKGKIIWLKGDNYTSLELIRKSLSIYEKIKDKKGIAAASVYKSKVQILIGSYNPAIESAFKSLGIAEEIENTEFIIESLNNLGMIFRAYENFHSAFEYYNRGLEISRKEKYIMGEALILNSLGNIYWFQKKYDEALKSYLMSLELYKKMCTECEEIAVALNNIGNIYREKKEYQQALAYYNESLELSNSLGFLNMQTITKKNLGFTHSLMNNNQLALDYLTLSLKLATEYGNKPLEIEICAEIARIYSAKNNYQKAYGYLLRSSSLRNLLFKEENAQKIAELKHSFEARQKENKIQQLELKQKTNERNFLIVVSVLGSFMLFLLLNRYYSLRRKNRENIKQKNAIEELNIRLKSSEARYRILYESISDAIVLIDFETQLISDVNTAACSLYGYKREEFLGLNIDVISTGAFPVSEYKENEVYVFPLRYHRNKGNHLFPVEIIANAFRIEGQPFVICSIRDITKRLSDEDKLRKSEVFFRSIWENSMDGMRIIDENGTIVLVNKAFCKMTGKEENELVGKDFTVIYNDAKKTDLKISSSIRFKTHSVESYFEKELTLWNGENLWFALSNSYLNFENEKSLLLSIFRDITSKKNSEKRLIESEGRFRMLAENTRDILWMVDNKPELVYLSPAIEVFLGYKVEEFFELQPEIYLAPDSLAFLQNYYYDVIRFVNNSGKVPENINTKFELEFLRKDGTLVWGELTASITRDKNNNITGFQGVARDINDRKINELRLKKFTEELQISKNLLETKTSELMRLNAQLVKSEKELKEINDSKDKFFSIVAHDLKSPFLGLIGFSNILVEEFEALPSKKVKEFLLNINKSTKNLYKLIEQLLEWSRLQLGKIPFEPTQLDAYESVMYSLNILRANAIAKKIQIMNSIQPNTIILADEQMLNSILENLISNAIKFTYPGGTIKIEYEKKERHHEIKVIDTGIGIKEQDVVKLFKIDNTFTNDGTANEKGTGLGLIIAKEMVEKHGGYISVESVFGEGSVFYFGIPFNFKSNTSGILSNNS